MVFAIEALTSGGIKVGLGDYEEPWDIAYSKSGIMKKGNGK